MRIAAAISDFVGTDRKSVIPALTTAVVTGFLAIVTCVSYPAVIFSGPLEVYLTTGIGIGLVSAVVIGTAVALTSTFPGCIGYSQSEPAVVIGIIAASMTSMLQASQHAEQILPTLFAITIVSSALCGAAFLLLGQFRLGNLVRYIPFPVVGGFLAGCGWLLLKAGLSSMSGFRVGAGNWLTLFELATLGKWVPGAAAGFVLWALQTKRSHFLNMPAVLVGSVALFWLAAGLGGASADELRRAGWLLGPFPEGGGIWSPLQHAVAITDAAWGLFPRHAIEFATLVLLASIGALLNASSIEIAVRRDFDLNRDLKGIGVANLLCAAAGGLPGFQSLSGSVLTHRLGTPVRLVGLTTAAVCLAALLFGSTVLMYVPKLVIGNILIYMAIGFLVDWLYLGYRRMELPDYAVLVIVFVAVVTIGFVEAIGIGTVAGIIMFVIRYSKISIAKNILSGSTYHSNVERAEPLRRFLQEHGDRIFILSLQGFMFFGTSNSLTTVVQDRLNDPGLPPLRYLVIDFRLVNGMDASAAASFTKLSQYADEKRFHIVFTSLSRPIADLLKREQVYEGLHPYVRVLPDLDRGLEWSENDLIQSHEHSRLPVAEAFQARIRAMFPKAADAETFLRYFERADYGEGETLVAQGATSDEFYFVESGTVSITLETAGGQNIRLRTMGAGTIVGEIAFYLGEPRSASVVAGETTRAYRLTKARLEDMKRDHPELASALHEYMARTLCTKLIDTNRVVGVLSQ
ncbi:MAG: cyclic nucleotide-binding domain-containing protein [Rhodospirillales bacterium]|nr:cyclic nucleotide-binding domain-containing protein [Rhodospirillales bacterium]